MSEPEFKRLEGFYPGSRTPVRDYGNRKTRKEVEPVPEGGLDLGTPRLLTVDGEDKEFYTIGIFALVLNRRPVTLRKWEADGILPEASYKDPRVRGKGKQRLYTRAQIEAVVKIANEEGILVETWKSVTNTDFSDRVQAAWRAL